MEYDVIKGASRRQKRKDQVRGSRRDSHFRTVRSGGFDQSQIICYLWDLVKMLEAMELPEETQDGNNRLGENSYGKIKELEKQMRSRVRVEIRRYFQWQKRRNRRLAIGTAVLLVCAASLFSFLIGVDRVSGNSMYPYLNHGDWIVYSRLGGEFRRGEVVVFEKDREGMVKRITGLPGDRVEISASGYRVVVNGTQIRERYVAQMYPVSEEEDEMQVDRMSLPLTVMDDQYLVLGDNRKESIDSRDSQIGTVSKRDILGRVVLVLRLNG